jgi:hypothetical protein
MLRRSDGSWTKDEKRLQCRKGDQKGNERELNHPAARPPLFQAPEVFQGQTLTAESVRQTVSPKLVSVLYWIADAEGVTRITHRLCHLSVLRMDEPASQHCRQLIRHRPATASSLAPWSVPSVAYPIASAHFAKSSGPCGSGVMSARLHLGKLRDVDYRTKTFSCSICGSNGAMALDEPVKTPGWRNTTSISAWIRSTIRPR